MRLTTLTILSILLLLFSCKKEEDESTTTTPEENLSETLITDYMVFPIGTKWIYNLSIDTVSEIDTITLISQDTVPLIEGAPEYMQVYIYYQEYYSSLNDYVLENEYDFPDDEVYISVYNYAYGFLHNQNDTITYLGVKLLENLETYNVNGVDYSNVRHFSYKDYSEVAECYVAKNIGTIKFLYLEGNDTLVASLVKKM